MRHIITTVITILIVLLFVYFFNQTPVKEKKRTAVPKQSTEVPSAKPTAQSMTAELDEKTQAEFRFYKDNWQKGLGDHQPKPLNKDPSYIEAYRDYDYARSHCKDIITSLAIGAEPFGYELRDYKEQMSEQQRRVFQNRVTKCQDLGHPTWKNEITMDVGLVVAHLKNRMDQLTPETAEEVALQNNLKQIEAIEKIGHQLFNLERGETIDFDLRSELYQQKRNLQSQYPQKVLFAPYAAEDMPLVESLNQQVAEIEAQMKANTFFDHDKIQSSQEVLFNAISQLDVSMKNTISGDGFWAIYVWFKDKHSDDRFDSYLKSMKQPVGIKKFDDWIQPIVMKFRACELGIPCGADAPLAESVCLDFRTPQSSDSCGKGVIDYYVDDHLSAHQLMDVEYVLQNRFAL